MVESIRQISSNSNLLSAEKREEARGVATEIWTKSQMLLKKSNFYCLSLPDSEFSYLEILDKTLSIIGSQNNFDLIVAREKKWTEELRTKIPIKKTLRESFIFNTTGGGYVSKETYSWGVTEAHEADKNELQDLLNDLNGIEEIKKFQLEKEKFEKLIEIE